MSTAWHYATIAFQPYPDVGEFANVGVLAVAAPARVLAYRLLPARMVGRIQGFFPELDITIYREGRKRLEAELERLEAAVNNHSTGQGQPPVALTEGQPPLAIHAQDAGTLFKALTAPRDGLFRFHPKGVRLGSDPTALLDALFERHVNRSTAEVEDPEEMRLVHQVGHLLEEWRLRRLYRRNVHVGGEAFTVRFPFGYQPDETKEPQRVIKPLNLDHPSSTHIYHHGDQWVANLKRLRQHHHLPAHVLLPVRMPLIMRGASRTTVAAAEEIHGQLQQTGVTLAPADDLKALRAFAEVETQGTLVLEG